MLLALAKKTYRKRTIVFFNEKIKCHRMAVLFHFHGLNAVEAHGNLT